MNVDSATSAKTEQQVLVTVTLLNTSPPPLIAS